METGKTKKIAIFASGSGTNAEQIIKHFESVDQAKISMVLSNNKDAYVLTRAENYKVPTYIFNREEFYGNETIIKILQDECIDLIVLAGFLWLVPENLIMAFPDKIINIHPALLPKYGGKGMYGKYVHEAVIESGDSESGITIHYVNQKYDEGKIIFQARCSVDTSETPETLASKIHKLEHDHFPKVIEELILN